MALGDSISISSFWFPEYLQQSAWVEHGPFAFWLVDALRPGTIVELGTHWGFSYFSFCQAVAQLKLPTQCYAVDNWQGDEHAGFYEADVFATVNDHNNNNYSSFSRLIRSNFDEALGAFNMNSIDLLHIDGRHYYEDVKRDFESWMPKLSDTSVVLFHDTSVCERDFGVFRLWAELVPDFPHFEFHHGHGLGVLGFGKNLPEPLKHLMAQNDSSAAATRLAYERLGLAVAHSDERERLLQALNSMRTKQNAEIAEQNSRLAQLEAQATELLTALTRSETEARNISARLARRDAEIAQLKEGAKSPLQRLLGSSTGIKLRAMWRDRLN